MGINDFLHNVKITPIGNFNNNTFVNCCVMIECCSHLYINYFFLGLCSLSLVFKLANNSLPWMTLCNRSFEFTTSSIFSRFAPFFSPKTF
jgi:hypothetical protein